MAIPKEWLEFLREQYPVGSRIKVKMLKNEQSNLKPGNTGTLMLIDDDAKFHVKCPNDKYAILAIGEDMFRVLPPEPKMLKLYMPLTAELFERNQWGDMDDDPIELDGKDLAHYADEIIVALQKERHPEEVERGIMHWFDEDEAVDMKVRSAVFTAELRDGQMWGVVECLVAGELTPDEMKILKDYLAGQASDGLGESFEQHEIQLDSDAQLFVHLWQSGDWSIKTEEEQFGPRLAAGLPDMCWSVLPGEGKLICIKAGEKGYYPSDWDSGDPERNRQIADSSNEARGITKAQEEAMLTGSMFGWGVPGADPKYYEQQGAQMMGGMS